MKRILLTAIAIFFVLSTAAFAQDEVRHEGWFYQDEHPEIVESLGDHEFATGILDALADAGQNWVELWGALDSSEGILWSHAAWLIINMPHLDRIEMTRNTLLEHVRFAYATRTSLSYTAPQEMFREFILTYRIGDEPVRPWRSEIWYAYDFLVGDSLEETARNINQWTFDNMESRERGFFGPRPDPWSVITGGTGTEADIATATIALCKTFGVPARRARIEVLGEEEGGRTWLEVYTGTEWVPMYPDNPEAFGDRGLIERDHPHNVTVITVSAAFTNLQVTESYSDTGIVRLRFMKNGEEAPDFEHFTLSAWNDGMWWPLDDLYYGHEVEYNFDASAGFPAVLGEGFYVVQTGVRNSRGDAYVRTWPVMVDPGDDIEMVLDLDIPLDEMDTVDLVQRRISLPEVNMNYFDDTAEWALLTDVLDPDGYSIVYIFDPVAEPSIRMTPMIFEWAYENEITVYGIGIGDSDASQNFWTTNCPETVIGFYYADTDGVIAQAFGHNPNDDGEYPNLPMVLLWSADDGIIYLHDGINLSVTDGLNRALELTAE